MHFSPAYSMDPSPFVRHTFWSAFVLGFFNFLSVVGLGQAAFQRFASVSSLSIAVRYVQYSIKILHALIIQVTLCVFTNLIESLKMQV